jgi:hypothetical protein
MKIIKEIPIIESNVVQYKYLSDGYNIVCQLIIMILKDIKILIIYLDSDRKGSFFQS